MKRPKMAGRTTMSTPESRKKANVALKLKRKKA
jgi:hypothetical protein